MASPAPPNLSRLNNLRVLVAEDDPEVAQSLDLYLQLFSCKVEIAPDGSQALQRALQGKFDLIVLDLNLPGMDGLSVCQTVRRQRVLTPILMLTARVSESDRVIGLQSGADDYMTKPFSPLELDARLNALMRRSRDYVEAPASRLVCDDLVIDIEQRTVAKDGVRIELTAREFDLLLALARHPGRVHTREQLLNAVWGYNYDGYGHTVNSHINRLRAKIECDPAHPDYVLTVWSVGYKFCER
jgi:DNA-binding response OmpR family regulator